MYVQTHRKVREMTDETSVVNEEEEEKTKEIKSCLTDAAVTFHGSFTFTLCLC